MSKSNVMHHTNEYLEERSKVLFNSEYVSQEMNERNQKEWVKSVQGLGNNWLFSKANYVTKKGSK